MHYNRARNSGHLKDCFPKQSEWENIWKTIARTESEDRAGGWEGEGKTQNTSKNNK
jgi:hypothetical protein